MDNFRLNNLSTKNEKHRNAYRTLYKRETRKQRLKYSLLGTGYSTEVTGALAALGYYALLHMHI